MVGNASLLNIYSYYRQILADTLLKDRVDLESTGKLLFRQLYTLYCQILADTLLKDRVDLESTGYLLLMHCTLCVPSILSGHITER